LGNRVIWIAFAGLLILGPDAPAAGQTIAVKAGLTSGNITESPNIPGDTLRRHMALMAGVSVTSPVAARLALQIEGLFTQKGNHLVNDEAGIDSKLKIEYVEIPVLLRFDVASAPSASLRVHAGPTFGFKLHRTESGFDVPLPEVDQINIKGADVGIAFGAEIEHKRLTAGARYTLGLSNMFDDDPVLYGVDKLTNRVFAVYGGWLLKK
jgi:hypothetical protein